MYTHPLTKKIITAAMSVMMIASAVPAVKTHSASSALKGDINTDGETNSVDLSVMSLYLAGRADISMQGFMNGDLDGDGVIDSLDLIQMRKLVIDDREQKAATAAIASRLVKLQAARNNSSASLLAAPPNWADPDFANTSDNISKSADDEFIKPAVGSMNGSLPSQGNGRVCIFYTDFPDCRYSYEFSANEISNIAFADEDRSSKFYPHESINGFFMRSSKYCMNLSGEVYRYTAKHNKEYYENDNCKVKLIDEILENMDESVDFTKFDGNGDNILDAMIISVPEAAGNENWWPNAGQYAGAADKTADGKKPGYVVIGNAELKIDDRCNFVASYIHELAHCMGLPDYYIYGEPNSEGLHGSAGYDTMDKLYSDFSCVSKLMLGWYTGGQVERFIYNGYDEQTFTLTDGQSINGNCVIIPYKNKLADDYCSEFLILEYTSLRGNNSDIPQKYRWQNYGSGIRIFHVDASKEIKPDSVAFLYRSGNDEATNDDQGRRFIRVVKDLNIDNLFRAGSCIDNAVSGFAFYDEEGQETVEPFVSISVGEFVGDSYTVTISKKGDPNGKNIIQLIRKF